MEGSSNTGPTVAAGQFATGYVCGLEQNVNPELTCRQAVPQHLPL